jgi:hypothetical protein
MGLFARGYSLLAREGDRPAEEEAQRRLSWLSSHPSEPCAWGYPFDWQSTVFIPAGTPSSVVTATVADAYRELFARTGGGADEILGACRFVETRLARPYETDDSVCFSYTPIDRMAVHNANLLAGELLLFGGHAFDHPTWRSLGRRAFTYTIDHQRADGAWDYWGPPDVGTRPPHIDAYHTGFVLRMLRRAHALTGDDRYAEAAHRGYAFFNRHLLDGVVPRNTAERDYPVDGHAVAETLLTHLAFRDLDAAAADRAGELLRWANAGMRDERGFYYYLWSPRSINRLPMMRWVQGWMFLALAAWLTDERNP